MRNAMRWIVLLLGTSLLMACGGTRHHAAPLPDPASFNAHFSDLDANGDGQVVQEEFQAHFPQATPEVFAALDLNGDQAVDHDEWHTFKEAHGLKDH